LPQIAQTVVEQQRATFDPVLSLTAHISQTKTLPETRVVTVDETTGETSSTIISGPFSKNGEVTPSLQHTIPLGSSYTLSFINTRSNIAPSGSGEVQSIADPRYDSNLMLTFTQPLLRDFGIQVNTTFIRQAQKTAAIAEQQAIQTILDIIFAVQQRYWELVFRLRELDARRDALKLAKQFLDENKIKVDLKVLAPVELFQSQRQVKFSQGNVVAAENAVQNAEDRLKAVLNLPESERTWQVDIRPTDKLVMTPLPDFSEEQQLDLALHNRPDMIQSQLDIESRKILRDFARNQLLPRLDFIASGRLDAFGNKYDKGVGNLGKADGYDWLVGLQVEYPLGNRFARQQLQQRKLELQQAVFDQQNLILLIATEVRQAVRDIRTAGQRVSITRDTTEISVKQLQGEREKFEIGLSSSFQILQFQDQLTEARLDELLTLSNYHIALAKLDQITGTLQHGDALGYLKSKQ
jgi:outer membrane protein TolC